MTAGSLNLRRGPQTHIHLGTGNRYVYTGSPNPYDTGKTAFGQVVSYALSKVGKPEMVLKNEQLTAIQHVYNGKDAFVWLPTGYPSLSVNATRDIGPKQPRRSACFASTVNKLVACFASSSERQKRQRYLKQSCCTRRS